MKRKGKVVTIIIVLVAVVSQFEHIVNLLRLIRTLLF